ncbi:mandelate racemase/muconate lactonizing enzyme family protein [Candidatus Lucifugimonas marina]|uniref:Mandelate racemase/muconate lactonizing enzyme family protein n=1 Tax=Candidatus Lucifugimonas marina TaxID=3038979 RepID=A0AAJ5ZLY9_9CHLR|nr:mandelate racemase/muconate lactonizing enzyme family protein [SAR202 cluster bacterium JH702]MDG0869302.1 mandelate racemase/muconate lactonizing enzyme family protein [SAR202 cluster bacterium JH639]WFG36704.1 mandelate racemase/muconate lactonizing enzyme family protein [SAR202 cluster bacterium JH545]WFG40638.1 mandelate racemase/muconate lactonizing enzyme family protein [SAR202 cluster bacterium JH1073]
MKIEAIDLFYVALPEIKRAADGTQDSLVVRVRTDNGLEGWGECDASPLVSMAAYVMPMSHSNVINIREALLGETLDSPEDVIRLRNKAGEYGLDVQQLDHAVAGADIALWDVLGKHLGEPVWKLIGHDASHKKLPYASVLFGDDPAETRAVADSIVERDFRAAKFGWGPMGRSSLADDIALVQAARDGLGPDAKLMVDAGVIWGDNVDEAYERAVAFADLGVTWLEEPLRTEEVGAYKALSDKVRANNVNIGIAGGEGADYFRAADDMMTNAGLDFVQIDVGRIGGITEAKRVADKAHELGIQYVNHTFKSHLSVAASIHVFAGYEEFDLTEYPAGDSALILGLTAPTGIFRDSDGLIRASDEPGLGVEVNLDAINEFQRMVKIEVDGEVLFESDKP